MYRRDYAEAVGSTAAVLALGGCVGMDGDNDDSQGESGGDGNGGSGAATVELWHDKGKNPNWNPIFEVATPELNEYLAEDSIEVEVVPYQSTDGYQGALRPVLGQEKGPGVFSYWAGQRLANVVEDGYAQDITDVWDKHIEAGRYPESLKTVFSVDGTAYAVPNQVNYWPVWYNTDVFDDLGVSPPNSWDEFRELTQTIISESGGDTVPVMLPLSPGWTGFIWFEELLARQDLEFYNQLCAGEAKYTDDTAVRALELMGQLQKDGVFGDSSVSFSKGLSELPRGLNNGDYAMTLMGSWVSGVFGGADIDFSKYDWFELPAINRDMDDMLIIEPGPFVIHKDGSSTENLKAVADGLLSTQFRRAWTKELGGIPLNAEVDRSHLGEHMKRLATETAGGEFTLPLRYWENTSPEVAVPASKEMKRIFQNPDDADGIAESLEQIRADVYG
jgi:multiple sugar transport system substrate-binding protein